MSKFNDTLRRFEQADPASYYERQANQKEITQLTEAFLESGGIIQELDSFIDKQEEIRKKRIKEYGKSLHDKPAKKKQVKKRKPNNNGWVNMTDAAAILGYSYTWLGMQVEKSVFPHLSIRKEGGKTWFLEVEIEALVDEHHKDNFNKRKCKLTADQVRELRNLHDQGVSQKALAEHYGLAASSVHRIVNNQQQIGVN